MISTDRLPVSARSSGARRSIPNRARCCSVYSHPTQNAQGWIQNVVYVLQEANELEWVGHAWRISQDPYQAWLVTMASLFTGTLYCFGNLGLGTWALSTLASSRRLQISNRTTLAFTSSAAYDGSRPLLQRPSCNASRTTSTGDCAA